MILLLPEDSFVVEAFLHTLGDIQQRFQGPDPWLAHQCQRRNSHVRVQHIYNFNMAKYNPVNVSGLFIKNDKNN